MPDAPFGHVPDEQATRTDGMFEPREPLETGVAQSLRREGRSSTGGTTLRQHQVEQITAESRERRTGTRDEETCEGRVGGEARAQRGQPTACASGASGTSRPNQCDSECRA